MNLILILSAMLASLTAAVSGERSAAGTPEAVQGASVAAEAVEQVAVILVHAVPALHGFDGFSGSLRASAPQAFVAIAPAFNILSLFAQRRE